jgi:amino acid adenylation domain-containing protein
VSLEQIRLWIAYGQGQLFESIIVLGELAEAVARTVPLIVSAVSSQDGIRIRVDADAGRFDGWAIERTLNHLVTVITALATMPDQRLNDLVLLDDQERARFLELNRTSVNYRNDACIHELFSEQASLRPDAIAVTSGDVSLTYSELDRRSNQLAHYLSKRGVGQDVRVALCLERTPDMIVSLLGILKAGGGYLPLDAGLPKERLSFMLKDADVSLVLTATNLAGSLPADRWEAIILDREDETIRTESVEALTGPHRADQLAYVNYTSGSTGTPKGVEVVHRAVNRLVCAVNYVQLGPDQALLHAAPLSFDASTFEIWGALLNGGRCVLYLEHFVTPDGLALAIRRHHVSTLWLTTALFNAVVDRDATSLLGVRQLVIGGEALSVPHVRAAFDALPDVQIVNGYGPTEATTFAVCYRIPRSLDPAARSIPIGRPIRDTRVYVLDEQSRIVPVGVVGELYIGGAGLARGYLNRPELTAEKFVSDPFEDGHKERLYRTGDLVRYLPDGTLDFVGRADGLVKIRGFRIELGEIELALAQHPSVRRALITASGDAHTGKRINAYLVSREGRRPTTRELREYLKASLPEYMVPSAFVWLPELPISPNGKVDRVALPLPSRQRPDLANDFMAPRSSLERLLCTVFGEVLAVDQVGIADGFFELGGDSLSCLDLRARLERDHGIQIPVVELFRRPTPQGLADFLSHKPDEQAAPTLSADVQPQPRAATSSHVTDGVAVIGMAGRFPGAGNVEEMWRNLCAGVESIKFWSDSELDEAIPESLRNDPHYVRARGVLSDVERFDAAFFGINPKEAEVMDPQQRLFLEVAWESLENAGYAPKSYSGLIGVFGGMFDSSYFAAHVSRRPDLIERVGAFHAMVGHQKDYVTTRVAHRLGLTGPALTIQTACSTSLVAVVEAFFSLRARRCDMALAGGVAITCPPRSGYLYQEGAMLSDDGHTRPFDANAQGTVFSDGAAIVVLKRLDDALADGDSIYAVIRGAAVNNDGADRASFSAPSVDGQAAVIAMAQASCRVDPRTVSYIEAHGTATPLGDPIEVEALTRAFRHGTQDKGFCALGSVKANLGHLVMAAGVTGLIKTVLALTRQQIPPTINFRSPNTRINFDDSPFYVNAQLQEWPQSAMPRRAGVSSFGVGGTNAHVVVEEAPNVERSTPTRLEQLIVLSARTSSALETATSNLAEHLRIHPDERLADIAFTLQAGRQHFAHRRVLVANDVDTARKALESCDPAHVRTRHVESKAPVAAMMFPGQGSQYVGMGSSLYRENTVFRGAIDECAERIRPHVDFDLRQLLYERRSPTPALHGSTAFVQPALFATEYALAQHWMSVGVRPQALIGHSVGEFVCAVLAGVFSLEDALHLVVARGQLMQELPGGTMLSVRLAAGDLIKRLPPKLALASSNGPSSSVASGPTEQIEMLQSLLEAEGIACRVLRTSHAFHSSMMDSIVAPFCDLVSRVNLRPPRIPILSTVTATWLTPAQATDPMYWARHLRETVWFAKGMEELWKEPDRLLLEVGPGSTLTALAKQHVFEKNRQFAVATLADSLEYEWSSILKAGGQLWLLGIEPDWSAFHQNERRWRVPLPTYPFERRRFWIDAVRSDATRPSMEPEMQLREQIGQVQSEGVAVQGSRPSSIAVESSTRRSRFQAELKKMLEDTVGVEIEDASATFTELGLDSLTLTQTARQLQKAFGVTVTFRQLMERYPNLDSLAACLEDQLPPEPVSAMSPMTESAADGVIPPRVPPLAAEAAAASVVPPNEPASTIQGVIDQQLRLMAQQLALLSASAAPALASVSTSPVELMATPSAVFPGLPSDPAPPTNPDETIGRAAYDATKAFGAIARIHLAAGEELTPKQRARLDAFVRRYSSRTRESKRFTQANRPHLADPRAVSGFRPAIKELVYPIVIDGSKGSRLWDVDGNEYVDVLCGFGAAFFGWQPEFISQAVKAQIDRGIEIGPQHPLAGEVARSVSEMTGFDRAGFCNTGSEAVMGAMRIARTVTGRDTIAIFTGSYHGIFDEVIVRGTKKLRAMPAAPGILPSSCQNVLVLDYGTPESLEIIRSRAGELAAVMVEPVQSRRPDFQPRDYLVELRRLTEQSGALYIFDEMITGFRVHPRGAQGFFGIRADLATYGKLVGGGYPIGIIAGRSQYMDALDGGAWQFGDDSAPTVGVTYFAGTFVRHPLALAAAKAVVDHLKERGPRLQEEMNEKTAQMVRTLNEYFTASGAPLEIRHFGSLWKTFFTQEQSFGDLLFLYLRDRGLHILEGFPCFLNTAHSEADIAFIIRSFKESVEELQESGFLPEGIKKRADIFSSDASLPPVPGARLGRDPAGTPAWYVPHPEHAGEFLKVESV